MKYTLRIQKAFEKAAFLHKSQTRKGDGLPFITHLFAVGAILGSQTDDEEIIIAGFLHDALEDVKSYKRENIQGDFGERVAGIVEEVSEDKSLGKWKLRKEGYLKHLREGSQEALMVSCADKIHNLRSLIESYKLQGDELWKKFNASKEESLWFYKEVLKVLKERLKSPLVEELEGVWGEMREVMGG